MWGLFLKPAFETDEEFVRSEADTDDKKAACFGDYRSFKG